MLRSCLFSHLNKDFILCVLLSTKDPLLFLFSEITKHFFLHKLERRFFSASHNAVAKSYLNILSWFDMLSLLTSTIGFLSELNGKGKSSLLVRKAEQQALLSKEKAFLVRFVCAW